MQYESRAERRQKDVQRHQPEHGRRTIFRQWWRSPSSWDLSASRPDWASLDRTHPSRPLNTSQTPWSARFAFQTAADLKHRADCSIPTLSQSLFTTSSPCEEFVACSLPGSPVVVAVLRLKR